MKPTAGAVETLADRPRPRPVRDQQRLAWRRPRWPQHLREMGFTAKPDDVVTSAQSAARLLAGAIAARAQRFSSSAPRRWPPRSDESGLSPVRQWSDGPVAVVQGHSPADRLAGSGRGGAGHPRRSTLGRRQRRPDPAVRARTAARKRRDGRRAAHRDRSRAAGGRQARADTVDDALARGKFRRPLVVGDRLDTDIAGADAAGLPSLMVLSGVSTAADMRPRRRSESGPTTSPTICARCTPAPTACASGHTRRGDVDVGPRAVTVQSTGRGPGRPAVGGACHRERGLERPARRRARRVDARATTRRDRPWSGGPCSLRRIG